MDTSDLTAIFLTFKLASMVTVILLLIATPLAWFLTRRKNFFTPLIEALVATPLALPPTVLGFFLLLLLGKNSFLGELWYRLTGHALVFNFAGLLIGSVVYSLPFAVQPLQNAFMQLDYKLYEIAQTLGTKPWRIFLQVVFPLTKRGFLTAGILTFVHTVGEFGVVLMIGGNIPGVTRVVSIAIYDHVQMLEYAKAMHLSLYLFLLTMITLFVLYGFKKNS